jgi:hypothetical protein
LQTRQSSHASHASHVSGYGAPSRTSEPLNGAQGNPPGALPIDGYVSALRGIEHRLMGLDAAVKVLLDGIRYYQMPITPESLERVTQARSLILQAQGVISAEAGGQALREHIALRERLNGAHHR